MPTILRVGPYRFFFYAGDYDEPIHVHVERDDKIAKYWLEPIRLESSGGFNRLDLSRIFKIIEESQLQKSSFPCKRESRNFCNILKRLDSHFRGNDKFFSF